MSSIEHSVETISNRCNLIEPLFKPCVDIASFVSDDLASALRNIFSAVTRNNEEWYETAHAASYGAEYAGKGLGFSMGGNNVNNNDDSASKRKRMVSFQL